MKKIRGESINACEKSWYKACYSGFDYSKIRIPWCQKAAQVEAETSQSSQRRETSRIEVVIFLLSA
jgi:hypothetical protein